MTPVISSLLTIGAFARASRLSVKALRFYDDLGLLPPAQVDAQTSHRLSAPAQPETARLIGLLRQLDMPLTTIRSVLNAPSAARPTLIRGPWETAQQHGRHRALARYVLDTLEGASTMTHTYEIHTREVPARRIATMLRRVYQPELETFLHRSIGQVVQFIGQPGTDAADAPFVIYHGEVTADSDGPVEVCVPYRGPLTPIGDMTLREEEPHTEAYVTLTKAQFEFPDILRAYDALAQYAQEHGTRGPLAVREVYPYDWDAAGPEDPAGEVACPYAPAPVGG